MPSIPKITAVLAAAATLLVPAAAQAAPGRPALASPAADVRLEAVPAFTWNPVKKADRYEFQLAADSAFGSIVDEGSFQTRNTAAAIDESLPDGTYWWRVRAINAKGTAGRWAERSFRKSWSTRPQLLSPVGDALMPFPAKPLVLRWTPVPRAYKYRVYIATDPALGSLVLDDEPIETSGTVFAPGRSLPPGKYFWAVEAVDATSHRGARSAVGAFETTWPSSTTTAVSDLIDEPEVMDPHMAWAPVAGAVGYQVEVNYSDDWSVSSKVCCGPGTNYDTTPGTELSPTKILPNNVYNWRVRAVDADGNTGLWNVGTPFDKHFGNVPPTVPNLRLRDRDQYLDAGAATDTPIVTWDPVPGAADYETQIVPRLGGICDWTDPDGGDVWRDRITASTAWTPLSSTTPDVDPPDPRYVNVAMDGQSLVPGRAYCFRVRARTGDPSVYSDWTQLGGIGSDGFVFAGLTTTADPLLTATGSTYMLPAEGSSTTRAPLFTWKPVQGANSYWVVVAKDEAFTQILDVAFTRFTAYAPRQARTATTYPDDTTPYYWAILPSPLAGGGTVGTVPVLNSPRSFVKSSTEPAPLRPAPGADVPGQPVFRWSWREGAKEYQFQVAQDPTFANLIDDVKTQATSYTPVKSYPADTVLYWRVRVTDVKGRGLTWSPTRTFRRRLPVPQPLATNPLVGATIPALGWAPVQGAASYTIHADQSDGTTRDFTQDGTVFTPVVFYGTGVWHWQVRANFPAGATRKVSSAWSTSKPFTRLIPAPRGVNAINSNGRMLISWEPSLMAKFYRVEISTTNSFSTQSYEATTANLAVAPPLTSNAFRDGGTFYWRVAVVDEGDNIGGYAAGSFKTPKRMVVRMSGSVMKGARGPVSVTVTDARGHAVKRARVKVSGAARAHTRRTNKRGIAKLSVRGRRRGAATIRVTRTGYQPGVAALTVR